MTSTTVGTVDDLATWATVEKHYSRYLLSSGKSPGTLRTYLSNVVMFWRWCHAERVSAALADRQTVRAYIGQRRTSVSTARAHNDLASLRHFFTWLIEIRHREDNPTEGLRIKRGETLPTKPLTTDEIMALLGACTSERDRLLILMLANTGVRIAELAEMRAEDFDWQQGLLIVRGKGNKERLLAPALETLNRLLAYLSMFPEPGPIWRSQRGHQPLSGHQIRKIIYEVAQRAKIPDVHPHRFRAYYATEFVGRFKDIQALQAVLGHTSIETTQRYSRSTREMRGHAAMRQFGIGTETAGDIGTP